MDRPPPPAGQPGPDVAAGAAGAGRRPSPAGAALLGRDRAGRRAAAHRGRPDPGRWPGARRPGPGRPTAADRRRTAGRRARPATRSGRAAGWSTVTCACWRSRRATRRPLGRLWRCCRPHPRPIHASATMPARLATGPSCRRCWSAARSMPPPAAWCAPPASSTWTWARACACRRLWPISSPDAAPPSWASRSAAAAPWRCWPPPTPCCSTRRRCATALAM